jgi:hypothetical protein
MKIKVTAYVVCDANGEEVATFSTSQVGKKLARGAANFQKSMMEADREACVALGYVFPLQIVRR